VEVLFEFVEAGAESSELFEVSEGALDAVARAVEGLVELTLIQPPPRCWDDGLDAMVGEIVQDVVHVIALVGQNRARLEPGEQRQSLCAVVAFPAGEQESHRAAQCIGQQVDLGRQTSSASPQSLVAPFLRPVAAC